MKGFRSFLFWGSVSALGIVTMLESANLTAILVPAVCHVDPEAVGKLIGSEASVPDSCVGKVVAITGAIVTALGVAGKILRFVTTSPIFKP